MTASSERILNIISKTYKLIGCASLFGNLILVIELGKHSFHLLHTSNQVVADKDVQNSQSILDKYRVINFQLENLSTKELNSIESNLLNKSEVEGKEFLIRFIDIIIL